MPPKPSSFAKVASDLRLLAKGLMAAAEALERQPLKPPPTKRAANAANPTAPPRIGNAVSQKKQGGRKPAPGDRDNAGRAVFNNNGTVAYNNYSRGLKSAVCGVVFLFGCTSFGLKCVWHGNSSATVGNQADTMANRMFAWLSNADCTGWLSIRHGRASGSE